MTWNLETCEQDGEAFIASIAGKPVTSINRFVGIKGRIFLITVDRKECYVYTVTNVEGTQKRNKDAQLIDFEFEASKGLNANDFEICNVQVAYNGKFFAVGLVSEDKSLFGVFGFDRNSG